MPLDPKIVAGMALTGGRHYGGRGLGEPPPWQCPSCGQTHHTSVADGCPACIAAAAPALAAQAKATHSSRENSVNDKTPHSWESQGIQGTPPPRMRRDAQPFGPGFPASPLLAAVAPTLDMDRLLAAIDDRIRQALIETLEAVQAPAAAGGLSFSPPELYALTLGLQLALAAQAHNPNQDPYLPMRETLLGLLERLQTDPALLAYVNPPLEDAPTAPLEPPTEG